MGLILLGVEGLFVQLATDMDADAAEVAWAWPGTSAWVHAAVYKVEQQGSMLDVLQGKAKQNSDHLRASTSNKTWNAIWPCRVADMLANYRKHYETKAL